MSKRTDIHRPGTIIPAHYVHVFSYSLPTTENGRPVPPINVDLVIKLKREGAKFAKTGGLGKCSVCGAVFTYGDVWRHEPSGEHIHLGHDCADKYDLLADRSAWEIENGRIRAAAAREVQKEVNAEARAAFLAAHPGLEVALQTKHRIIEDIADKFRNRYTSLSDAQVALVFKLADEVANPKPAEIHITAPDGRVTFHAVVVSVKFHEGRFGKQEKMTVKTTTPEGCWLAWGTVPRIRCAGAGLYPIVQKGDELDITATLLPGRDPFFAFMKRPIVKAFKKAVA